MVVSKRQEISAVNTLNQKIEESLFSKIKNYVMPKLISIESFCARQKNAAEDIYFFKKMRSLKKGWSLGSNLEINSSLKKFKLKKIIQSHLDKVTIFSKGKNETGDCTKQEFYYALSLSSH